MAEFSIIATSNGVRTLVVAGEFDIATTEEFREQGRACLEADVATIEVDLSDVTFIDSSGLGALVGLRKECAKADAALVLIDVPPSVTRLFEVTGLTAIFDVRAGD
ncbi:MAG TPA: STAS domain-containing protein [Marmoricola sp.]|nr:STAS domain-containing protein [Marmoricola sp.]